jgi:hypothetical protein
MFERMRTADDEERFRVHLYVLAHTLMKYRMLKWEGSHRDSDGVEWILFRNPMTDEEIRIREIDLEDERLIAVMREIEVGTPSVGTSGDAEDEAVDVEEAKSAASTEPAEGSSGGSA